MPHNYAGRKYEVSAYDPQWPQLFNTEKVVLKKVFEGDALSIEHVGSTSVPGLDAKPTIDILITVKNIEDAEKHIPAMELLSYKYFGAYVKPEARLFVKERPDGADRLFNVHIFPADHPHVKDMIGLRDYFRTHPETVEEYRDLKKKLAEKYPDDYGQYRKLKDEYMNDLKKRVLEQKEIATS